MYLARHTGDDVVIIFSARRGLLISKYFTVPSWLAVVRCVSSRWLQLMPWMRAKCAVMYCIGHEPFRKSQIRKSPSCAVANKLPDTRLKPTCVAPAGRTHTPKHNTIHQIEMQRSGKSNSLNLHMQTALSDIIGFFGSRKSHKCVNVSMEQLASKCGIFECQSMSVMTRVCARNE